MSLPIEKEITLLAGGSLEAPGLIRKPLQVTSSGNWNAEREPGYYEPPASGNASNTPAAFRGTTDWCMVVINDPRADADVFQIAFSRTKTYGRRYRSGSWSDWKRRDVFDLDDDVSTTVTSVAGTDLFLTAVGPDKEQRKIAFSSLYDAVQSTHHGDDTLHSDVWADRRDDQLVQTLEIEETEFTLELVSGAVTSASPGPVRYGYSRAAGPNSSWIKGGSFSRSDDEDLSGSLGIDAIWSENVDINSVSTPITHLRVSEWIPLLGTIRFATTESGSTTEYALSRVADGASGDNWGEGNYDEYRVVDGDGDPIDPAGFTSTSKTLYKLQLLYPSGKPVFTEEAPRNRALPLRRMQAWAGVSAGDTDAVALTAGQTVLASALRETAGNDAFTFWHHPMYQASSASIVRKTFQVSKKMFVRKGSNRLFAGTEKPGEPLHLLGDDGRGFGEDFETEYLEWQDADEPTGRHAVLQLSFDADAGSSGRAQYSCMFDLVGKRMRSAAPADLDFGGASGPVTVRAIWSNDLTVIGDENYIAPTGTLAPAPVITPRARNAYRLFGSEVDLAAMREKLNAHKARGDSASAQLLFVDTDGKLAKLDVASYGAISDNEDGNRGLRYIDIGLRSTNAYRGTPAYGSPVAVTVPRVLDDDAELFRDLGAWTSAASGDEDVWRDTGIQRGGGEIFGVSVQKGEIQLFLEDDLRSAAVPGAARSTTTSGNIDVRDAYTEGYSLLRHANGNYAVCANGGSVEYRFFRLSASRGFSIADGKTLPMGRGTTVPAHRRATLTAGGEAKASDGTATQNGIRPTKTEGLLLLQILGGDDRRLHMVLASELLGRTLQDVPDPTSDLRPSGLLTFDVQGREIAVGRANGVGQPLVFAFRASRGHASGATVVLSATLFEPREADGFAFGTAEADYITADGNTGLSIPNRRFFAVTTGSEESNAEEYRAGGLRLFRREDFLQFDSPDAADDSSVIPLYLPSGSNAGGDQIDLGYDDGDLWLHRGTTVPRLRPVRVHLVNSVADPQAGTRNERGAFEIVEPSLTWNQSLAGASIRTLGENGTAIVWPDSSDHLKVTIEASDDLTAHGRWEYQAPGATAWSTLHGKATGNPLLVSAGRSYSYRFPASSFRHAASGSTGALLKTRLTNADENNLRPADIADFTGSVKVTVDYESDEDSHAVRIMEIDRVVTITARPISGDHLSNMYWVDYDFTTPILAEKCYLVSVMYRILATSKEEATLHITLGQMKRAGFGPNVPTSVTDIVKGIYTAGYSNVRIGDVLHGLEAQYAPRYGPGGGAPQMFVGFRSDGAYILGLSFASFVSDARIERVSVLHTN